MRSEQRKGGVEKLSVGITNYFAENNSILCKIQSRKEVSKTLESNLSENEVSSIDRKCKKSFHGQYK